MWIVPDVRLFLFFSPCRNQQIIFHTGDNNKIFFFFFFAATAAIRLIAFDEFCARLFFVKKQKAKTEKGGDSHGWPQKTGERDVHLTGMFNGKLRKSRILFRTASWAARRQIRWENHEEIPSRFFFRFPETQKNAKRARQLRRRTGITSSGDLLYLRGGPFSRSRTRELVEEEEMTNRRLSLVSTIGKKINALVEHSAGVRHEPTAERRKLFWDVRCCDFFKKGKKN